MSKKLLALASTMGVEYESGPKFKTEYQYQATRTGKEQIFDDGRYYYAIQKKAPVYDVGVWRRHEDQFWAEKLGLTVWVAEPSDEDE